MTVLNVSSNLLPYVRLENIFSLEVEKIHHLPEDVRKIYQIIFREFEFFSKLPIHNNYLCHNNLDSLENKPICSLCKKTTKIINNRQIFARFPLLLRSFKAEIVSCGSRKCTSKVYNYFCVVRNNFGPFNSLLLENSGILKYKNDDERIKLDESLSQEQLEFKNMQLKFDASTNKLEVIVEIGVKAGIICRKPIFITLKKMIMNNPQINFYAVLENLPESAGGNFIRRYVLDIIGSQHQEHFKFAPQLKDSLKLKIEYLSDILALLECHEAYKSFHESETETSFEISKIKFIEYCYEFIEKNIPLDLIKRKKLLKSFNYACQLHCQILLDCDSYFAIEGQYVEIIKKLLKDEVEKKHIKVFDFNFHKKIPSNSARTLKCFDYAFYYLNEPKALPYIEGHSMNSPFLTSDDDSSYGYVSEILKDWGYNEVLKSKSGDLIIYFDNDHQVVHFGIIQENLKVISKWGEFPVFEHAIEHNPDYGNYYLFFRKSKGLKKRKLDTV